MLEVAVIVLTFNSLSKLGSIFQKAVESIFNQEGEFRVVFVDNGSKDETPQILKLFCRKYAKPCEVVLLPRNCGYNCGNNRGAVVARESDYLFFVNDDVILAPHTLSKLVRFAEEHHDIGAIQPVIVNRDGTLFYGFDCGLGGMCKPITKPRGYPFSEAFYASGAALLTPSELFFHVGMFPEKFFLYYDDVDYCWRVRRLGYRVGALVTAYAYHYGSATFGERSPIYLYYDSRNRIWSIYRNMPRRLLLQSLLIATIETLMVYVLHEAFVKRNTKGALAALRGLSHGFLKRFDNANNYASGFGSWTRLVNPRVDVEALIPASLRRVVKKMMKVYSIK